jgi:hypothetical protein
MHRSPQTYALIFGLFIGGILIAASAVLAALLAYAPGAAASALTAAGAGAAAGWAWAQH